MSHQRLSGTINIASLEIWSRFEAREAAEVEAAETLGRTERSAAVERAKSSLCQAGELGQNSRNPKDDSPARPGHDYRPAQPAAAEG